MRFDLHKKMRFFDINEAKDGDVHMDWIISEIDTFIEQELLVALLEYYSHLLRIGFRNEASLLKYFGNSFFHDGEIRRIDYDTTSHELSISIVRENDLEDINRFLSSVGERRIDPGQYFKNPATYVCTFSDVSKYQKPDKVRPIVDTELNKTPSGKNRMCISGSPFVEIEFEFSKCTVRIENMRHVRTICSEPR